MSLGLCKVFHHTFEQEGSKVVKSFLKSFKSDEGERKEGNGAKKIRWQEEGKRREGEGV